VWILVSLKNVASMHNVQQEITVQLAIVCQTISQIQIPIFGASSMNVLLILIVQVLLLVSMKSVLILASVRGMQIVLPEITREFAHASLDMRVILMELLARQVSCFF
jgi:hypothetical protein